MLLQEQIDELKQRLLAYENAHTPPSKNEWKKATAIVNFLQVSQRSGWHFFKDFKEEKAIGLGSFRIQSTHSSG